MFDYICIFVFICVGLGVSAVVCLRKCLSPVCLWVGLLSRCVYVYVRGLMVWWVGVGVSVFAFVNGGTVWGYRCCLGV